MDDFITVDDIRGIMMEFSYLPGWEFTVLETVEGNRLDIVFSVPDSNDPNSVQVQCVKTYIPPCRYISDYLIWLRWRLNRLAIHEVGEWFLYRGERTYDPHAESYG